jgi:hypothetical protein
MWNPAAQKDCTTPLLSVNLVGVDRTCRRRLGCRSLILYIYNAMPIDMLVAEVTTTDLRKSRYPVESKDDIGKTRQGYEIETADGETVRFAEEDVESISVVEE